MQETLSVKKMRLAIMAAAMAVIVAFSMGIGAQVAQAEEAIPYGSTVTKKIGKVTYKFKNGTTAKGVAIVKVKAPKSVKTIDVPATVKLVNKKTGNYHTYNVKVVEPKAFKGTSAKTIKLPKTIKTINKNAFKGSKATKLYVKTKLTKKVGKKTTKVAKKNWLKGSKIKKVYSKSPVKTAKKLVKKSYSGKAGVKAYKK